MKMMTDYHHFCAHSGQAQKNSLFFALKGNSTDGHRFLEDAKKNGAKGAVVSTDYHGSSFGLKLSYQSDPHALLLEMARRKLVEIKPFIIGVTGSIGKTTTKEFLLQLLDTNEYITSTINENSKKTLPLKILNETASAMYILEMGMMVQGDIEKLVQMAPPDLAVLTEIAYCHTAYFSSLEAIAEEKTKILKSAKKSFIHTKNRSFIQSSCRHVFYATKDPYFEKICQIAEHLPSCYHENLHAAFLVAKELGQDEGVLWEKLSHIKTVEGRLQKSTFKGVDFINDAFNASRRSFESGIQIALSLPYKRKIAVVAPIPRLGKFHKKEHAIVRDLLQGFDAVFCLGDFCHGLSHALCFACIQELVLSLKSYIQKGDLVYLKGGSASNLHSIVKTHFSEV